MFALPARQDAGAYSWLIDVLTRRFGRRGDEVVLVWGLILCSAARGGGWSVGGVVCLARSSCVGRSVHRSCPRLSIRRGAGMVGLRVDGSGGTNPNEKHLLHSGLSGVSG